MLLQAVRSGSFDKVTVVRRAADFEIVSAATSVIFSISSVGRACRWSWKDTVSLKRAYQQADAETILSVVLNGGELREEPAETVPSCTQHCTPHP